MPSPAAPSSDSVVVLNELHYNPAGPSEDGEWVEVFNQMGIKVDLSGWYLSGGIDFRFPAGTIINPGAYLVVWKTPAAGQLGPLVGSLDNGGESITLFNQSGRLMDSLDYGDTGRWPVAADGSGATLAKRDPYTANKPLENWTYSSNVGGTPGTVNFPPAGQASPTIVPLLSLGSTWRFNEQGPNLGAAWAATTHAVDGTAWRSGAGVHAYETGLAQAIGTPFRFPGNNDPYVVTYYFETEFTLSSAQVAALQSLQLRHLIDDGAVFYLNGVEITRTGMPDGPVIASTRASASIEATLSATLPVPTRSLVAGSNRISVEVHQATGINSDVVFGLELEAVIAGSSDSSAIRLNEIPAAGAAEFWIELVNAGTGPADLSGLTISAEGDPLRTHSLAAGTLGPGELLELTEQQLGFRPADGENVFLHAAAGTRVLDGQRLTGSLRGRAPSKGGEWLYPSAATPGGTNTFTFRDEIVISEIHYNPPDLPGVPAMPPTFSTTALINYGDTWRYNSADENLPANWAATVHPVGGNWRDGTGPVGVETVVLPVAMATTITPYVAATVTYYFEREFNITAQQIASSTSIDISHMIDDGAIFYINGTEIPSSRFNMPAGAIGPETLASPSIGDASIRSLVVSPSSLIAGSNRISVEVHQSATNSSDIVFGLKMEARVQLTTGMPGAPPRKSDNQWIEIANRSAIPVDLGGWEFDEGISFTFPAGTVLAPGHYACLAASAAEFTATYPGARLLGEFTGNLSRSGERLSLRSADKNPVDEVRYFDAGRRWPEFTDGGGSSLELRDLDADNGVPEAWAASNETQRSSWQTYSYRATGASKAGPDSQWRDFCFGLLQAGEVLLDDISVKESPDAAATQFLSNTNFESGFTGWRLLGNHRLSNVITDPDNPGNKVLHLVAEGGTEHMHNHIETTLASGRSVSSGNTYEISFRAKWLTGSNQLHTRLYFNRAARNNLITRPLNGGTPSAPNSRAVANIGPTFTRFLHSPTVPNAGQAVTVTAQAADVDIVSGLTLFYRANEGSWSSVTMSSGTDGNYSAAIPGQAAATVVQFYVRATDGLSGISTFPARGPDSRALYKVRDGRASGTGIHNFRIIMTTTDGNFMHTPIHAMSNAFLGATVIDREQEIYYDVSVHLKGGQRARSTDIYVGYTVGFNGERLYRGIHPSVGVDRSGTPNETPTELMFDIAISNAVGSPSRYNDLLHVIAPRDRYTGPSILQMARYDDVFLDSQYENGADGHLYEYELIYYPTTADGNGFKLPQPDNILGQNVGDLGPDKERYRWFFLKKNNRGEDNFDPIIRYNQQFGKSGAAFEEGLDQVIDVDGWLRGFAYSAVVGSSDNIASGFEHNGVYYARPDGRVVSLPHDMDFSWNASLPISVNPGSNTNPECVQLTQDGRRKRIYLGHLHDIVSTTFNNTYMSMWSSHFNTLNPGSHWSSTLSYINSRSTNVLSQINISIPSVAFAVTSTNPHTVASSTATVNGNGWINVRNIRVQGSTEPLAVTWTGTNTWTVTLPAPPGTTNYVLQAVNFAGAVIDTANVTVNNTTPVQPASSANLVIPEIMYHSADPTPAEITAGFTDQDQFEFLEVQNISTTAVVDLTGVRFTAGIDYNFAAGTQLLPGARLIIAANRGAFLFRYPGASASLAAGSFLNTTQLSNGGESITLTDALGGTLRAFAYDDNAPWPTAADGKGPSLVLMNPATNPNHSLAANWRASTVSGGNPGTSDADAVTLSGSPTADNDYDGQSALLEHGLGSSDSTPGAPVLTATTEPDGHITLNYTRRAGADDVIVEAQLSIDLTTWSAAAFAVITESLQPDSTIHVTARTVAPSPQGRAFTRVQVRQR